MFDPFLHDVYLAWQQEAFGSLELGGPQGLPILEGPGEQPAASGQQPVASGQQPAANPESSCGEQPAASGEQQAAGSGLDSKEALPSPDQSLSQANMSEQRAASSKRPKDNNKATPAASGGPYAYIDMVDPGLVCVRAVGLALGLLQGGMSLGSTGRAKVWPWACLCGIGSGPGFDRLRVGSLGVRATSVGCVRSNGRRLLRMPQVVTAVRRYMQDLVTQVGLDRMRQINSWLALAALEPEGFRQYALRAGLEMDSGIFKTCLQAKLRAMEAIDRILGLYGTDFGASGNTFNVVVIKQDRATAYVESQASPSGAIIGEVPHDGDQSPEILTGQAG